MAGIWFVPVCDSLFYKISVWHANYNKGEIFATRSYMTATGPIDKPTMYAHKIVFTTHEMEHLVRILKLINPSKPSTQTIIKVSAGLKKGVLVPPKGYLITLAMYENDVNEIYEALKAARNGTYHNMDNLVADQKEKAPFEL